MTNLNAGAPHAERVPFERRVHGQTFIDYYEWLRDADNSQVMEHIDAENDWFEQHTQDQQDLRDQIVAEIAAYTKESDVSVAIRKGAYWYWTRTWQGRPYEGLYRVPIRGTGQQTEKLIPQRPENTGRGETCIYDGNQLARFEEYFAAGSVAVSPDGKLFAMATDTSGDESFKLRIQDIDGHLLLDDGVEGIGYCLAWLADSSGVFYTRYDDAWRPYQVWLHRVGTWPAEDVLIFEEDDEKFGLYFEASRDGRWVVVEAESTDTTEVHLISTRNIDERILVRPRKKGVDYSVEPAGEELLIIHNANNPGFELASAPVKTSDPEQWTTLVSAAEDERLLGVEAFQTFAALLLRSAGGTEIRILERTKKGWAKPYRLPIAETLTVDLGTNNEWVTSELVVVAESLIHPRTWLSWDVENREMSTLKTLEVPGYDEEAYVEYREWATGADGTKIPLTIAHRADLDRQGENPGFIYGYGAYEMSQDPYFSVLRLPILDRGVVYAIAHVRGGGELGRSWYEDGRLLKKTNSFDDFVAASKHLLETKLVGRGRLAAEGRSAGGLLMGAIANLAPELYAVILAGVPFVDALTTILKPELPLTVGEWEEWGNPLESEEVYRYMAEYSPYENIRPERYPAILATTSMNDVRVSYVEPTKWVQQLRETVTDDSGLIVQYTEKVAGHFGGSGRYQLWERRARELAFVLRELGVA